MKIAICILIFSQILVFANSDKNTICQKLKFDINKNIANSEPNFINYGKILKEINIDFIRTYYSQILPNDTSGSVFLIPYLPNFKITNLDSENLISKNSDITNSKTSSFNIQNDLFITNDDNISNNKISFDTDSKLINTLICKDCNISNNELNFDNNPNFIKAYIVQNGNIKNNIFYSPHRDANITAFIATNGDIIGNKLNISSKGELKAFFTNGEISKNYINLYYFDSTTRIGQNFDHNISSNRVFITNDYETKPANLVIFQSKNGNITDNKFHINELIAQNDKSLINLGFSENGTQTNNSIIIETTDFKGDVYLPNSQNGTNSNTKVKMIYSFINGNLIFPKNLEDFSIDISSSHQNKQRKFVKYKGIFGTLDLGENSKNGSMNIEGVGVYIGNIKNIQALKSINFVFNGYDKTLNRQNFFKRKIPFLRINTDELNLNGIDIGIKLNGFISTIIRDFRVGDHIPLLEVNDKIILDEIPKPFIYDYYSGGDLRIDFKVKENKLMGLLTKKPRKRTRLTRFSRRIIF